MLRISGHLSPMLGDPSKKFLCRRVLRRSRVAFCLLGFCSMILFFGRVVHGQAYKRARENGPGYGHTAGARHPMFRCFAPSRPCDMAPSKGQTMFAPSQMLNKYRRIEVCLKIAQNNEFPQLLFRRPALQARRLGGVEKNSERKKRK
jgi:hypothetical protein